MLWLIPTLLAAPLTEISVYPADPVPGVVLRNSKARLDDPTGYRLEPVTVNGFGQTYESGAFRRVLHADGRTSLVHGGLVGVLGAESGDYDFFLAEPFPTDAGPQELWLGVVHPEKTLATWIVPQHGASLQALPDVVLPGAEAVVAVRTWRESCPGGTEWTILAVSDKGISTVVSASSTGEAGWYTNETLYLPTRQPSGALAYVSMDGERLDEPVVSGQVVIHREVGEPTEEGAYTSEVVEQEEIRRTWAP